MKYEQVIQTSRPYEYGEGKEFATKEEAQSQIKKLEQKVKTNMALNGLYKISEVEVTETSNALQMVVTTLVSKLF